MGGCCVVVEGVVSNGCGLDWRLGCLARFIWLVCGFVSLSHGYESRVLPGEFVWCRVQKEWLSRALSTSLKVSSSQHPYLTLDEHPLSSGFLTELRKHRPRPMTMREGSGTAA